jgi:hypothetical protein
MSHVDGNGIDFLCGKVTDIRRSRSGGLIVYTLFDQVTIAPGQDEAIWKIEVGRRRMIVLREGIILGLYGRPRIRLLQMILRGTPITQEIIECSFPMYPKSERSLPSRNRKPQDVGINDQGSVPKVPSSWVA